LEKNEIYQRLENMIISSTKKPKYVSLSAVKMADLFNTNITKVEHILNELINEGKLQKSKLQDPPNYEIYLLP